MPRQALDSYTNEPYVEDYKSPFKNLNAPKTLYKEKNVRVSGAYKASREADGRWRIWRLAQPAIEFLEQSLGMRDDELAAVRTLHWCVANDKKIIRAIRRMNDELEFEDFINICITAQEA